MDFKHFTLALDLIFATTENEMDCDELQSCLPAFVQVEMAGKDSALEFPAAAAHLMQCTDCAKEYRELVYILRLETQDRLPDIEQFLSQFPIGENVSLDTDNVSGIHSEMVSVVGR